MSLLEAQPLHTMNANRRRLDQLPVGQSASVVSVGGDRELRRRLLEMGFCNGVTVQTVRRAPLGDPIEFRLRGYLLSLRNEQARHIHITMKD
jgi:Fe2+ transport system protein FeoA